MAQVDYFMKFDPEIKGESLDDKHKGELELESWSWGETQSGTSGHGSGAGSGKVQPQDMHFVKKLDKSSPLLFMACANGEHFKKAILTARKAGKGQQEYLKVTLENVLVSSYQVGGSSQGDVVPTDQVSLNFGTMEFSYKEQKPDGSLGGEAKQKYDFAASKKV